MANAIGIMGGTFDPIHYGHLLAAEEARVRFHLDRITFVPNREPPHKKDYPVSPAHRRYDMVRLATAANPNFDVSRVELDRSGPSYAIDTVKTLRHQLGSDTGLYFITGADAIMEVLTWRAPEEIGEICDFIAVTRPGHDLAHLAQAVSPSLQGKIHQLDIPGVDISSTEIRRRAMSGLSLRYLIPPSVVRYIATHGLYANHALCSQAAR